MSRRQRPAAPAMAPSAPRRRFLIGAGALGALAGCGGGGAEHVAGVGTGGTGQVATFTSGPISGFGSVIVNGIRFDDSAATIGDDLGLVRKQSELGLGMVVEIDGTADAQTGQGVARAIRVVSLLAGQVRTIDAAAGRFTVMAVTVGHDTATVWNTDDGARALQVGDRVEIWGFLDVAAGVLRASRIEITPAAIAPAASKVRGTVTALDTTNRWMSIDGQFVDLRDLPLPTNLAVGSTVAAVGSQIDAANVPLRASTLAVVTAPKTDAEVAIVENVISGWESLSRFRLLETWVDASSAEIVGGTAASLQNGVRVRAIGERVAGSVRASTIEVRSLLTVTAEGGIAPHSDTPSNGGDASNGNATANSDGNANPNANGNANGNANANANGNGNGNGAGNGNADTHPIANNGGGGGGNPDANPIANNGGGGNNGVSVSAGSDGNAGSSITANGTATPASISSPPATQYVVDKVQVTGMVVVAPRSNRMRVTDASLRTFSVDIKGSDISGGRRGDLDLGAIVRVTGKHGSPIEASDIRIVRKP